MIFIQAMGGLGNQLFIWNLAHHLEYKYDCKIRIVYPKNGADRKCELSFLVNECSHRIVVVESNLLNRYLSLYDRVNVKSKILGKTIARVLKISQTYIPSETIDFGSVKPVFVRGYFQSPDFVKSNISTYLAELLNVTKFFAEKSRYYTPQLLNSQMMHIRRGDFITNKETVGLLSLRYFEEIIDITRESTIFTDSNSNERELSSKFPNSQILGADLVDTWTGFSLMSFSKELHVSNSTYSWWAGLISHFRGGQVVAPNPWTLTNVYGEDYLKTEEFILKASRFEGREN